MSDIFISFAVQDKAFADFLHNHLAAEGLDVFQASLSLEPGQQWGQEILQNLRASKCVLFLASMAACQSAYVQQEVGASIISGKKLIPVVWDMPLEKLPGWANQYQAINLTGASIESIQEVFTNVAEKIRLDKRSSYLMCGLLIVGLYLFLRK